LAGEASVNTDLNNSSIAAINPNTCPCGQPARPRAGKSGPMPTRCAVCRQEIDRATTRAWQDRNQEIHRLNDKDWRARNPRKLVEYTQRYRAKKQAVATAVLALAAIVVTSPVLAHDWYDGLKRPSGGSCCSDQDCQSVPLCALDGREGVTLGGTCRPIEWGKVLRLPSPDGQAHACWRDLGNGDVATFCFVLPGSS
jgi:hypothetical protein